MLHPAFTLRVHLARAHGSIGHNFAARKRKAKTKEEQASTKHRPATAAPEDCDGRLNLRRGEAWLKQMEVHVERVQSNVENHEQVARPAFYRIVELPRFCRPAGAVRLSASVTKSLGADSPRSVKGMAAAIVSTAAIAHGALVAAPVFTYPALARASALFAALVQDTDVNSNQIHAVHSASLSFPWGPR